MFLFQMHWKHLAKIVCILMVNEIAPKNFYFSINNEINIECQKRGREFKRIEENWKHGHR